jgi:preprotein translocase subunit SecE
MASKDKNNPQTPDEDERDEERALGDGLIVPGTNLISASAADAAAPQPEAEEELAATDLGTSKYVHAAFLAAGILGAFLTGRVITTAWNYLSQWSVAVNAVPQLLSVGEVERDRLAGVLGVILGLGAVIYAYRKESVRRWADDVALELSKVTWPDKDAVTNGTVVVLVASIIAMVYVMILDRFWGFLTSLIYET